MLLIICNIFQYLDLFPNHSMDCFHGTDQAVIAKTFRKEKSDNKKVYTFILLQLKVFL